MYVHIYFGISTHLIPLTKQFNPQVSPLFQKLEAEQIDALKKKFGGQQVHDVHDV